MKIYGCPYKAEMILAKIANLKTQTRRIIVPQPPGDTSSVYRDPTLGFRFIRAGNRIWPGPTSDLACNGKKPPRGDKGDRQYWQEAFDFGGCFIEAGSKEYYARVRYKADRLVREIVLSESDIEKADKWRRAENGPWRGMPAMFMLRSMSRGLDEIVDVRVERVQSITDDDAIAEGISWLDVDQQNNLRKWGTEQTARMAYADLWNSINASRDYSWQSNPWVFVYETKEVKS